MIIDNGDRCPNLIKDVTAIEEVEKDLPNQVVIKADCKRTRGLSNLSFDFKLELEQLLTYYCKLNNIKYKQGMNEVYIYIYIYI